MHSKYGTLGISDSSASTSTSDLPSTELRHSIFTENQRLTASQRVNYYATKIPFIPSFKSFNGVKVVFIVLLLHRLHFYSVFSFIQNLNSTSVHDSDDSNINTMELAAAYIALSFFIG